MTRNEREFSVPRDYEQHRDIYRLSQLADGRGGEPKVQLPANGALIGGGPSSGGGGGGGDIACC
jgi:GTPase involved in cell partitioning and DNA repair